MPPFFRHLPHKTNIPSLQLEEADIRGKMIFQWIYGYIFAWLLSAKKDDIFVIPKGNMSTDMKNIYHATVVSVNIYSKKNDHVYNGISKLTK